MWVTSDCVVKPDIEQQVRIFIKVWDDAEDIEQVAERTGLTSGEVMLLAEILRGDGDVLLPVLPIRGVSRGNNIALANKLDYRWLLLEARKPANWIPSEILEFMTVWNVAEREETVEKDLKLARGEARELAEAYQARFPMLLFKVLDFIAAPEIEAEFAEPFPKLSKSDLRALSAAVNASLKPGTVVTRTVSATQLATFMGPDCVIAAPREG